MSYDNIINLIGDVDLGSVTYGATDFGTTWCKFNMCTSRNKRTGKGNERAPIVTWHRIIVWGKLADACKSRLGKRAYVKGWLEERKFEDHANPDVVQAAMDEIAGFMRHQIVAPAADKSAVWGKWLQNQTDVVAHKIGLLMEAQQVNRSVMEVHTKNIEFISEPVVQSTSVKVDEAPEWSNSEPGNVDPPPASVMPEEPEYVKVTAPIDDDGMNFRNF